MATENQRISLRPRLLILWAAFLGALGCYALVAFLVRPYRLQPLAVLPLLRWIFLGMGGIALIAAIVAESILLNRERLVQRWQEGGPGSSLEGTVQTAFILGLALGETVAIGGLVLFFLGDSLATFGYFLAATVLFYLLWMLPRALRYPTWTEEMEQYLALHGGERKAPGEEAPE